MDVFDFVDDGGLENFESLRGDNTIYILLVAKILLKRARLRGLTWIKLSKARGSSSESVASYQ